jgi:hypothetical protein
MAVCVSKNAATMVPTMTFVSAGVWGALPQAERRAAVSSRINVSFFIKFMKSSKPPYHN